MEVAKVDASGGSESASGTEESEAVEPDLYYYHTDHLGSTTHITDKGGKVVPYKFNGKELDQETGYYYYGARYYDPSAALFLGVDPIADKYPYQGSYVYAAGNPVRFIDYFGFGPTERVEAARQMTGIPYKQETSTELRTSDTAEAMEYMDCSELVSRVMAADNITSGVEHLTSGGIYDMLSSNDNFESSTTGPEFGDIAVWKGHIGIVTEVSGEKFKMVHARGANKLSAENNNFASKEQYSSATFRGFFRETKTYDGGELRTIEVNGKPGFSSKSIQLINVEKINVSIKNTYQSQNE